MLDPAVRFRAKVRVDTTSGCHLWMGALNSRGYGSFGWGGRGRTVLAHRWAKEHLGGVELAAGVEVHHRCENKRCVNPAHLEVLTHKEHNDEHDSPPAENARKIVCLRGHALDGPNLRVNKIGRRVCRTCERARRMLGEARRRDKANPNRMRRARIIPLGVAAASMTIDDALASTPHAAAGGER